MPGCVSAPVPPIAAATVSAALRLKTSAPAFVTAPVPSVARRAAIAHLQRAAADRRAAAVGVGPVRMTVPEPLCVTRPTPLITLPTVTTSLRLNTTAPLLTTAPVPSVPRRPAVAHLQRAGAHRRRRRCTCWRPCQDRRTRARLRQTRRSR